MYVQEARDLELDNVRRIQVSRMGLRDPQLLANSKPLLKQMSIITLKASLKKPGLSSRTEPVSKAHRYFLLEDASSVSQAPPC